MKDRRVTHYTVNRALITGTDDVFHVWVLIFYQIIYKTIITWKRLKEIFFGVILDIRYRNMPENETIL